MPELPDVEVFRRYLQSHALRQRIHRADVAAPGLLRDVSVQALQRRIRGRRFVSTHRHGKYLFLELDRGGWLLLHFGMTGYAVVGKQRQRPSDHARLRIHFADGQVLSYFDPRKLGRIEVVDDLAAFIQSRKLGPDALTVKHDLFRQRLQQKKASAKAALMDQQTLAGIGNVYADEILFKSNLSPLARLTEAKPATWARLYRVTRQVLREAIRKGADPSRLPRTYLLRHRHRTGQCPRCHRRLRTIKVGGRTTYFCPRDQRRVA